MKRALSFLLCVVMLSAMVIMPTSAAEVANMFELSGSNIHHYYMGDEIADAPTQNGIVSSGEYSTSSTAEGINVQLTDNYTGTELGTGRGITNVVQYFAYDEDHWYIAVTMKDTKFAYGVNKVTFAFNFNAAGGFSDICSRVSLNIGMTDANTVSRSVSYMDQHAGNGSHAMNYSPQYESICDSYSAKYDSSTQTVTYEVAIKLDGLREEYGFTVADKAMYYMFVTNDNNAGDNGADTSTAYCPTLTSEQRTAIANAVPAHQTPGLRWGAHIVHFEAKNALPAFNNFRTINGASVRMYSAKDSGIRFATEYSIDYIKELKASGKRVSVGTLIAPVENLKKTGGVFTKEALLAATTDETLFVDVKADIASPYAIQNGKYVYAGSLIGIQDKSVLFAGIGYVEVDGVATYSDSYSVRSVSGVAFSALRDFSASSMTGYTNATKIASKTASITSLKDAAGTYTVYSPYTKAQRNILLDLASGYNTSTITDFFELEEKAAGTIRLVTANMFFHEMNWVHGLKSTTTNSTTKANVEAAFNRKADALAMTGADVILLQEMSEGIRTSGKEDYRMHTYLDPKLEAKGYTQVNAIDTTPPDWNKVSGKYQTKNINQTPIWYNANTMTLEASGHEYYDTISDPDVGDGDLSDSKSFTWALFTKKSTGEQFIAISTHFSYHGNATLGEKMRLSNATQLVNYINDNLLKYNVPIIVGGDLNTSRNGNPYKALVDNATAGLDDARNVAGLVKNGMYGSSHGYCNTDLATTPKYEVTFPVAGGGVIDHIIVSNNKGLDINQYMTIITDEFTYATDHVPQLIDFNVK